MSTDISSSTFRRSRQAWALYLPMVNVALAVGVAAAGGMALHLYSRPATSPKPTHAPAPTQADALLPKPVALLPRQPKKIDDYDIITHNNLFSPNRAEWPAQVAHLRKPPRKRQARPQRKKKRPTIICQGTVIVGRMRKALVNNLDADRKDKKRRKFVFVSEGQSIGDYIVKLIERDQITLEWEGEQVVIPVIGSEKKVKALADAKKRKAGRKLPPEEVAKRVAEVRGHRAVKTAATVKKLALEKSSEKAKPATREETVDALEKKLDKEKRNKGREIRAFLKLLRGDGAEAAPPVSATSSSGAASPDSSAKSSGTKSPSSKSDTSTRHRNPPNMPPFPTKTTDGRDISLDFVK